MRPSADEARTAAAPCSSAAPCPGAGRRWAVLAGLTLVSFLLLLDDTAVAVALPAVQRQLGLSLSGLEWVINAYTLTLAVLMLLAGQMADRHGRRRIFLAGLAIFTLASLAAGLAPSAGLLIAARAVQGVGAALVAPASLSIIAVTFPEGQRGAALGVWAGVSSTALGLGPLLGALINDSLGWAWIFLLNVPLGVTAWFVARAVLPESRSATASTVRLDVPGLLTSGGGLLTLLLALSEGNALGWGSPRVVALLAAAAAAFALFVWRERRAAAPLIDLTLLRQRSFAGANVVTLLATSVMCSLFFFLALYLQTVLSYSALEAGASLLPLTATIVAVAPLAGRLADRTGARMPVSTGMALLAVALLGLSGLQVDSSLSAILPWLALAGLGIGLTTTPTTTAALASSGPDAAGVAAGVLNTFRTTGLALGIAVMGAILVSFGPAAGGRSQAFVDGFSVAVTVNAGIALLCAAVAARTLSGPRRNGRREQAVSPSGAAGVARRAPVAEPAVVQTEP